MQEDLQYHRRFVGSNDNGHYEKYGMHTWNLLTSRGLEPHHKVLDVGCGSLRHGRIFIPRLDYGCYFGIEPAKEILKSGIENELEDLRGAQFDSNEDFNLSVFGYKFDWIFSLQVFIHCSERQLRQFLENCKVALKSNGKVVFNVNISEDCGAIDRKPKQRYQHADYVGCWYKESVVQNIFSEYGFQYEDIRRVPQKLHNNKTHTGIIYELSLSNRLL